MVLVRLNKSRKGIPLRYAVQDAIQVFKKSGFYLVFIFAIFTAFTFLNPGKDVIYMLLDGFGDKGMFWVQLTTTLMGLVFWSMAMEFGARYSVYVSDTSGKSLSAERVVWRKALQKAAATFFLVAPFWVMAISVLKCYLTLQSSVRKEYTRPFVIILLLLLALHYLVTHIYFYHKKNRALKINGGNATGYFALSTQEADYTGKLYGIYNNYVFNISREGNFDENKDYNQFIESIPIPGSTPASRNKFPQSNGVSDDARVPASFTLIAGPLDGMQESNSSGSYKWTYEIPLGFYKKLHRQLAYVVSISIVVFVIICLMGINSLHYRAIGAPALAFWAFACWSGIYSAILFIDYGLWRNKMYSLRFVLVTWFIICSFLHGHNVRLINHNITADDRPTLDAHFNNWVTNYKKHAKPGADSLYPVVFVCAEGGASRTGAYTALFLSCLQDSLMKRQGLDFQSSIYSYSSVSGGSLGVGVFTAIANMDREDPLHPKGYENRAAAFFADDYLSPIFGRMLFGDMLNSFSPVLVHSFDRAAALEESWEDGFSKVAINKENAFKDTFQRCFNRNNVGQNYPAVFINTSEVETGLQCWLANVKPTDTDIAFNEHRDLINKQIGGDIAFSTVIDFSTRFPFLSPAGALHYGDSCTHYVDGGYVENTGAGTMLELLQHLAPYFKNKQLKPYVITLRFNEDSKTKKYKHYKFGNEFLDIFGTALHTRDGRSKMAVKQLQAFVSKQGGVNIDLPLEEDGQSVPENWVLSDASITHLKRRIDSMWLYPKGTDLQYMYFIKK